MVEAPSAIVLVGTVLPVRRSRLGSEIAGIVAEMPVRQGDRVSAGDVLCRLNNETFTHRLAEAQARLGALNAYHEELLAGTRPEELTRRKAQLEEAVAEFDRWKFEMDRINRLYAGRDSNQKEQTDTRASFLAAEQQKIAAQANFDLGVAGPRAEEIARAAFEVAEQQAVVDRIAGDLRKTAIRAPFDGYVIARNTEIGEWVPEGGQIAELVDLSTVLVQVDLPEAALPHVSEGDEVRVSVDALHDSFIGRIKHIMRDADPRARTFPVEIELDNSAGTLAGAMFARATVAAGPRGPVIAVPKDAIVEQGGIAHIAITMPDQMGNITGMLMGVTVGADTGEWITITSGNVHPGMSVITRGNEHMMPFPTPILIVDEKGTPIAMPAGNPPEGGH